MSTGRIVAATHCLILTSLKLPTLLLNPTPAFLFRVCIAVALHFLALLALSIAAAGDKTSTPQAATTEYEARKGAREIVPDVRQIGAIAGIYTLILPWLVPLDFHPLWNAGIRCLCFFMGCKVVELAVLRAGRPPEMMMKKKKKKKKKTKKKKKLDGKGGQVEYVLRLLTETRYASFDIWVDESKRRAVHAKTSKKERLCWTWIPRILVPLATCLYPVPELQVLLVLVLIHCGLEAVHAVLHPFCPDPLFFIPFAATGIGDFWSVHWHQGAQSWLVAVGYRFVKELVVGVLGGDKQVGSGAGVLGAFALSGVWHGWCAAPLSQSPWRIGLGLFLVFVGQGVGCLVERLLWKKVEGGWVKRALWWTFAIESGAIFLRWASWTLKPDVMWLLHPVESFFDWQSIDER